MSITASWQRESPGSLKAGLACAQDGREPREAATGHGHGGSGGPDLCGAEVILNTRCGRVSARGASACLCPHPPGQRQLPSVPHLSNGASRKD